MKLFQEPERMIGLTIKFSHGARRVWLVRDGEWEISRTTPVNGKAKVSQRAEQNVATFGLA
jgi:hypothetical protein